VLFRSQKKLYPALKKYGWDNFLAEIIDTSAQTQSQLDDLEVFYVAKFNSFHNGYNCNPGGRGSGRGFKQSKETVDKRTGEKNHMFGKHLSEETKRLVSAARMGDKNPMFGLTGDKSPQFGRHPTNETLQKMSKSLMGDKNPMFGKCGDKSPRFGKPHSEETKRKIAEVMKAKRSLRLSVLKQEGISSPTSEEIKIVVS
jgi:hypothetical protein